MSAGEERQFTTELVGGELAGRTADVSVTVRSVKEKELPELDDEFAQTASEFDTLEDLRADVRERLSRVRALEQGAQARDKVLEALLAATEVPLPESVVQGEVEWRQHDIGHQLEGAGLDLDAYLSAEGRTREDFEAEVQTQLRDRGEDPARAGRGRGRRAAGRLGRRADRARHRPGRAVRDVAAGVRPAAHPGRQPAGPGRGRAPVQGAGHGAGAGHGHRRVRPPGRPVRAASPGGSGGGRGERPTPPPAAPAGPASATSILPVGS